MGTYVISILVVLAGAGVTTAAALFLRKRIEFDGATDATVFTIVSGLHAVLAVFVLVDLLDAADATRQAAVQEADHLVAAAWAADTFPPDERERIRELTRNYATSVIEEEWPALQAGEPVGLSGWKTLQELRSSIVAVPADTKVMQDHKAEASDRVVAAYESRQTRLTTGTRTVSGLLWTTLGVGTIAALALTILFGGGKIVSYTILVATMAGVLTMLLVAVYQLQSPFEAGSDVNPVPFESMLARIR